MRPSSLALLLLAVLAAGVVLILTFFSRSTVENEAKRQANRELVSQYGLTDLALFTEARYTRHPSQADLHAAFQDHPGALEHFPTGSLRTPRALPYLNHLRSQPGTPEPTAAPPSSSPAGPAVR